MMTTRKGNQYGNFRALMVIWTIVIYQVVLMSKSRTELEFSSVLASGAPTPDCSLTGGVGKQECLEKIAAGCPLTFVGPGCGSGDGGCQPEGWCGFTCRRRCKNFDRCFWKHGSGCRQRATASPTPEPPTPAPTPQPPTAAPSPSCELYFGMNRPTCESKIDAGCDFSWVGPGCGDGDGGCQEKGWCGFTCRERCTAFDRCKWVKGFGCKRAFEPPSCPLVFDNVLRNVEWTLNNPAWQGPLSCPEIPDTYQVRAQDNVTTPQGGSFSIREDGQIKYLANADFEGTDVVPFEYEDAENGTVIESSTITFIVTQRVWFLQDPYATDETRRRVLNFEADEDGQHHSPLEHKQKYEPFLVEKTKHAVFDHSHEDKATQQGRKLREDAKVSTRVFDTLLTHELYAYPGEYGKGTLDEPFMSYASFIENQETLLQENDILFFYKGEYFAGENANGLWLRNGMKVLGQADKQPNPDFFETLGIPPPTGGLVSVTPFPDTRGDPDSEYYNMAVLVGEITEEFNVTESSNPEDAYYFVLSLLEELELLGSVVLLANNNFIQGIDILADGFVTGILGFGVENTTIQYPTALGTFSPIPGVLLFGTNNVDIHLFSAVTASILGIDTGSGSLVISPKEIPDSVVSDGSGSDDFSDPSDYCEFAEDNFGGILYGLPDFEDTFGVLFSGAIFIENRGMDVLIECSLFTNSGLFAATSIGLSELLGDGEEFPTIPEYEIIQFEQFQQQRQHRSGDHSKQVPLKSTLLEGRSKILNELKLTPLIESVTEMLKHKRRGLSHSEFFARQTGARSLLPASKPSLAIRRSDIHSILLGVLNFNGLGALHFQQNLLGGVIVAAISVSLSEMSTSFCLNLLEEVFIGLVVVDAGKHDNRVEMTRNVAVPSLFAAMYVFDITEVLAELLESEFGVGVPPLEPSTTSSDGRISLIVSENEFSLWNNAPEQPPSEFVAEIGSIFFALILGLRQVLQFQQQEFLELYPEVLYMFTAKPLSASVVGNTFFHYSTGQSWEFITIENLAREGYNEVLFEDNIFEHSDPGKLESPAVTYASCAIECYPEGECEDIFGFLESTCENHKSDVIFKGNSFDGGAKSIVGRGATLHAEFEGNISPVADSVHVFEVSSNANTTICASLQLGFDYELVAPTVGAIDYYKAKPSIEVSTDGPTMNFQEIDAPCEVEAKRLEPNCGGIPYPYPSPT